MLPNYSEFKNRIFSVSEISNILKQVLSSELFQNISIRGEITSKSTKNGNTYLTLTEYNSQTKQIKAAIKVNIFAGYERYITSDYKIGDDVIVKGDINYYPPFGSLSLNARSLEQFGYGEQLVQLEKLKQQLAKEGLFDSKRKKSLPPHISKIGIVTSKSGAAYQDILKTLKKKFPVSTVLFDAIVQGNQAPESLIRALDKADKSDCDVIIFGRGGGDKNDLSCFNDEKVVRRLANMSKVIITGIGHEIDTSLSDLVADIHKITPTAAAECCLKDLDDVYDELDDAKNSFNKAVSNILNNKTYLLDRLSDNLEKYQLNEKINSISSTLMNKSIMLKQSYLNKLNALDRALFNQKTDLKSGFNNQINKVLLKIKDYEYKLELINPFAKLDNGLALVKKEGKYITSIKQLNILDEVEIGFKDGLVKASIINKEGNK